MDKNTVEKVKQLRQEHLNWSCLKISQEADLSYYLAGKILKTNHLSVKAIKDPCGHKDNFYTSPEGYSYCRDCRKIRYYNNHPPKIKLVNPRREKIRILRQQHPEWSLAQIGQEVGVSRERIRQILKESNLSTKRVFISLYQCVRCHKKRTHIGTTCQKCQYDANSVFRFCEQCHAGIRLMTSEAKRTKINFCNKHCQGVWLGTNYGRGKQAQAKIIQKKGNIMLSKLLKNTVTWILGRNISVQVKQFTTTKRTKQNRYNHKEIIRLREKGLTYKEIKAITGASIRTISHIVIKCLGKGVRAKTNKMICLHGHKLVENNIYMTSNGFKQCQRCNTISKYGAYHQLSFAEALKIRDDPEWIRSRKSGNNTNKKYCKRGHVFKDPNILYQKGGRACKICMAARRMVRHNNRIALQQALQIVELRRAIYSNDTNK